MAAPKKPSGLGRGLGELLEDNSPIAHDSGRTNVTVRKEGESIRITPQGSTEIKTKSLYDAPVHKNRSVKANFKK